jgi:hypothetical protein
MASSKIYGSSPTENFLTNSRLGVFSSSTTENVGSDLVSNGAFSSVTTGWAATDCTIASVAGGQAGNCLEITRTGGDSQSAKQTITVVAGQTYKLTCYIKTGTSGAEAGGAIVKEGETTLGQAIGLSSGEWVETYCIFKPSGTSVDVYVTKATATAGTMLFDTVAVYNTTPAHIAADLVTIDGWKKYSGANLYREYYGNNVSYGTFYGIKGAPSAAGYFYWADGNRSTDPSFMSRFKGKTIAVGCWLKTSTASHIYLSYNDGSWHDLTGAHPGDGEFWWMEARYTMSAAATATIPFAVHVAQTSGEWYMSHPMAVFGDSIGVGNFQPMQNEIIYLDAHQPSATFGLDVVCDDTDWTDLQVEVDSLLVIPKDVKRVLLRVYGKDSGSAAADAYMQFRKNGDGGYNVDGQFSIGGLANSKIAYPPPFWVNLDADGVMEYKIEATGSGTFTVGGMYYLAVSY